MAWRGTYFMPIHCRDPLLNETRYFRNSTELGCSQRSGENERGFGNMVGLSCMRTEDIPTGVCDCGSADVLTGSCIS